MTEGQPTRLASLGTPRTAAHFADAERHRLRVKRLKIALPLLAAACVAAVFISLVVNRRPDVSLTGGQTPAIEMAAPLLRGIGDNGKPYEVKATQATQTREGLVELTNVDGRIELEDGLMHILAARGAITPETGKGRVEGGVKIDLAGEYTFETERADVDMKAGIVTGDAKVRVVGPMGTIEAAGFKVEKSVKRVTFTGGVQSVLNPAEAKKPEPTP